MNETTEITMELLSDLATALRAVTSQAFPSLPMQIEVRMTPRPHLVIVPDDAASPIYGHVIQAKATTLLASNALRDKPRLLDEILKGGALSAQ